MLRCLLALTLVFAAMPLMAAESDLPLLYEDDFEDGADNWEPTDPDAWRVVEVDGGMVYNQFKNSKYKPPHRSPLNISLLEAPVVGDFVLEVKVQSTDKKGGAHRDMCVFFGHQDPAHFYYVHLGQRPDPHSSQIMIVDGAPRKMITTNESPGIPWTDGWHDVKIIRDTDSGKIEVYFDDMKEPVMVASDKTFTHGRIGLGSFDNHGHWDDVKLYGKKVDK